MSENHVTSNWFSDDQNPLLFHIWLIFDQKRQSLFLFAILAFVAFWVTHLTESILFGFSAVSLMLSSAWYLFVPMHFEINTDGIVRTILGRKSFIAWGDIRGYQVCRNGILLLPRNKRFWLDAFRAYYLPVTLAKSPEVLYRFRVYVDLSEPAPLGNGGKNH